MPDLRSELRELEIPDAGPSSDRAWRLLGAAFDERAQPARRPHLPPGWIAAAILSLIGAMVITLTPAGAEVREWIKDTIADVGEPNAKPALTRLPAPGSLLVNAGPTVSIVREDGSNGRLGEFDDVSWSPHGLYVAAARGRNLQALTASGELRWEITGELRISDPVWSPNEGFRVAYRSGDELRVVWGDGTNDVKVGPSKNVVSAWQPRTGNRNVLAYADGIGRIRIVDVDSGRVLARGQSPGAPASLDWTRDGSQLLVVYRANAQVLDAGARPVRTYDFGRAGSGLSVVSASFLPGTQAVAALLRADAPRPVSKVVFGAPLGDDVSKRTIFSGSGRLRGLTVAPNGRQILVGWPRADQWLFIPTTHTNRIDAVANIRRQFGDDADGAFPRVNGWCCQAR
jgi:hypothetical protein